MAGLIPKADNSGAYRSSTVTDRSLTCSPRIADAHGPTDFEPPHCSFADELVLGAADAVGIDVLRAFGVGKLQFGRPAAWRFLAATALAR